MRRSTPYTEEDWEEYANEYADYLKAEDKPMFWRCPNCKQIQATVIGEKACCVECGVRPIRPEPMVGPVI